MPLLTRLIWTKFTMPLHWTAPCADGLYTIHDVCDGSWILIAPGIPDQFFDTFEQARDEAEGRGVVYANNLE